MDREPKIWVVVLIVVLVPLLLSGCGVGDRTAPHLEFEAPMNVDSAQRFHVSLGVRNVGDDAFTDYDAFNGAMDLTTADGVRVGHIAVATLWQLAPGEAAWPAAFQSRLEPGAYRLSWSGGDYRGVSVAFTIVELDGWLYLGEEDVDDSGGSGGVDERQYGSLQSLVDLARVNLARRLGIDPDQVTVAGIDEVEFGDASLGVPEAGRSYAQVVTPGRVIRLEAAGADYEYRASSERLVYAPPGTPSAYPETMVEIDGVEVVSGDRVRVYGITNLPEVACIETSLSIQSGGPLPWWPAFECATISGGKWEIVVPLGEGDAPASLDTTVDYKVQAGQSGGGPNDLLFFDLAAPPGP